MLSPSWYLRIILTHSDTTPLAAEAHKFRGGGGGTVRGFCARARPEKV